jgi:GDP-4-dehydro-6-deoxy-D-mannose reductase
VKRILITGAGGFVGTHLIHALTKAGGVEIFASVYKSTSDISALLPTDHIISGDLTDYAAAKHLISVAQPDIIYHLAAISVVSDDPSKATSVLNTNSTITFNLLESARLLAPSARFISICSANVYGLVEAADLPIDESTPLRPLNAYAVSKITQEMLSMQYHLSYGLDVVILRPFNHSGPGQIADFLIPSLARQFAAIKKGSESVIEVGNTETARDYTDVRDMVRAYILAAEKGESGETYNIGSGHSYKTSEIIELFEQLTGAKAVVKAKDHLVRKNDVPILVADASKFIALTSWQPLISLETTLSDILEYEQTKQ